MKKTTIIVKGSKLGDFLEHIDTTPNLEGLNKEDLEAQLGKEFDINIIQKEIRDMGEENLKDLFDKLHAMPDDDLQDILRTYPAIKEIWHKHFTDWVYGENT